MGCVGMRRNILQSETALEDAEQVRKTIATLETQRVLLGDDAVDAALSAVRKRLAELEGRDGGTAPSGSSSRPSPSLSGERKLVTIVFADITGYTALADVMDPESVRDLVNACFGTLVPIVEKYGGTVDKFIGDEIMALFGAPITHESDHEWALRAALEMRARLNEFNREHHTDLGLHIGVNTGWVVAGAIGSEGRQQYSVMGDAVNLASRLSDAAQRDEIFVGEETHALTSQMFNFEPAETMAIKGKASPVNVYRLASVKGGLDRRHGIPGLHSPLVGRVEELRQLSAAVRLLTAGKGCTVSIIGEAGLGKSRLVAETRQKESEGVTWVEGRALSYTSTMSYVPVRSLLYHFLDVQEDTVAREVGRALSEDLRRLLPSEAEEIYPHLAHLLDVPLEERLAQQIKELSPEARQHRLRQAFTEYVRARALMHPVVMVWEDLHWVDPASLLLLDALVPVTRHAPLLLVLLFRPATEERIWAFHQDLRSSESDTYREINLNPLSTPESEQLVQNLLNIGEIPSETRRLIFHRAEGNPFFLEEMLRSLIDAGTVIIHGDRAVIAQSIHPLDLPGTLQEVIAARIDRLPFRDKQTLQTAAVVGRVFQQRVLKFIMEKEDPALLLDPSLTELRRRELIRRRWMDLECQDGLTDVPLEIEYIFKHAITQEVTYQSLLVSRRKSLHRSAAEAIETLFVDHLEPLAATLAYHYERAEMPEQAVAYCIRAANRAKEIFANKEAVVSYQTALRLVATILRRSTTGGGPWIQMQIDLHERLGDVLALIGSHDEALKEFQSAIKDVDKDDVVSQSRLCLKCAKVLEVQHKMEESLEAYKKAESVLGDPPADVGEAAWRRAWLDVTLNRGWLHYWQNQESEMTTLAERIRPNLDRFGSPDQRASFFNFLGMIGFRRERYLLSSETVGYLKNAVSAVSETANLALCSWSHFLLGFGYLWADRLDEAGDVLRKALSFTERTGDIVLQSRCLTYLTIVYRRTRQMEKFSEILPRSLEVAANAKMTEYVGTGKANQSWGLWLEGKLADAESCAKEAMEIWRSLPAGFASCALQWTALMQLLDIAVKNGLVDDAVRYACAVLEPQQKRMPDVVSTALRLCITARDEQRQPDFILGLCRDAIEKARTEKYL